MNPQGKRSRAAEKTRAAVMETAARLFREKPYAEVTIRGIAAAGGFSTGSVFQHARDKADLWHKAVGFPYPWRPIAWARENTHDILMLLRAPDGEMDRGVVPDVFQRHSRFQALAYVLLDELAPLPSQGPEAQA